MQVLEDGKPGTASGLGGDRKGIWYTNVFFPNETKFRATYKAKTYFAEIRDERWLDHEGNTKNSPSDAAGSISQTNVNGWRFWFVKRPGDDDWARMDELRPRKEPLTISKLSYIMDNLSSWRQPMCSTAGSDRCATAGPRRRSTIGCCRLRKAILETSGVRAAAFRKCGSTMPGLPGLFLPPRQAACHPAVRR